MNDFKLYFKTGWEHIISTDATDHILFILALGALFTMRRWKPVLALVTAFTIGHSLTLALSVADLVRFSSNWIEFLIPVTIVLTSLINLIRPIDGNYEINYLLALFFGLIHGMGFANTIRFMLAKDQEIFVPLLAFNLGLEAGQILVVAFLLALQWLIVQKIGLHRLSWIRSISIITLVWGVWLAAGRLP
ncbi:MAG: HupE/UreJ family protein [Sphingobacteriales bacterium]|nr:MAG: HupE/UreJ family protein [Sphingobacteriales bacterium]